MWYQQEPDAVTSAIVILRYEFIDYVFFKNDYGDK